MNEILDVLRQHWGIILTFAGLFASIFWLKLDSKYAKKQEVGQLLELAKSHETKIITLETQVKNLPSAVEVEQLKTLVTDVKGDTKATSRQVDSISHQLGLLLEAKLKE